MPGDYLLQLFETTRQMLLVISAKREAGGPTGAREEIEKTCLQVTGISFDLVRRYSPEALIDLLRCSGDVYQKSILLAELLIQYAEVSREEEMITDEIASTLKAYCLLSESIGVLNPEEKVSYYSTLDILAKKLSIYKDDPYIREKLRKYAINTDLGD
jgi:hypothetical protein